MIKYVSLFNFKAQNYKDFTFDDQNLCQDVLINISAESTTSGIIHSPSYFKNSLNAFDAKLEANYKCKWTFNIPAGNHIELT